MTQPIPQQPTPPPHNKGNALVLAMMVVSITAAIAYALIETSTFAVRRTTQINNSDMCKQAVYAAEMYAAELLKQEIEKGPLITELQQDWALPFELRLEQEITIKAQLSDLQGQFNVNLLTNPAQEGLYSPSLVFARLLESLNIPDAQSLQQSLVKWVTNQTSEADLVYMERTPPYRAAHMPLVSISELNLVEGFIPQRTTLLYPYISALSETANINVNTASSQVLGALLNTSESAVRVLTEERLAYPFKSSSEFVERAVSRGIAVPDQGALTQLVNVDSKYFLLETTTDCRTSKLISYSFMERNAEGNAKVYQRTQQL